MLGLFERVTIVAVSAILKTRKRANSMLVSMFRPLCLALVLSGCPVLALWA
jgi:hypothetical protein